VEKLGFSDDPACSPLSPSGTVFIFSIIEVVMRFADCGRD
jgi:hypothetical protein